MDAHRDPYQGPELDERVAERIAEMTLAELRDECDTFRANKGRHGYRFDRFSEYLRETTRSNA